MNKIALMGGVALSLVAATAHADTKTFRGSDTLFGVMTDAINLSGLATELQYLGGGTTLGEEGVVAGTQGLAPMSRAPKAEAFAAAAAKGIVLTPNVIGLDGVAVYVKATNATAQLDVPTLKSIFGGVDGSGSAAACADAARVTTWDQIPGSGQTGALKVLRRDDVSGTTDTFKSLVGVKAFCADVTVAASTAEIAVATSTDPTVIAFAGLSALRPGENKDLAIGKTSAGPFVVPSEATIRDFTYPLARRLYVVSASGAVTLTFAEEALLTNLLDPSFADPILTANEFITCAPEGCP